MWKLYTFTLRLPKKRITRANNRRMWIGFESNYNNALKKAKAAHPGFEVMWYSQMTLLECLYLLPFFEGKQDA